MLSVVFKWHTTMTTKWTHTNWKWCCNAAQHPHVLKVTLSENHFKRRTLIHLYKSHGICRWCTTTTIYHWHQLVHLKVIIVFDLFIHLAGFRWTHLVFIFGSFVQIVQFTLFCSVFSSCHAGYKNNALIGQEPTQDEIAIIIAHICNISHRTESNVAIIYERQTMAMWKRKKWWRSRWVSERSKAIQWNRRR